MNLTGRMKVATLTILLTLLGLLSVQAYLLWVTIETEGERFDDLADKTLLDIHHNIEDDSVMSASLIRLLSAMEKGQSPNPDSVRRTISQLRHRIDSISQDNDIDLQFDFILFDTQGNQGRLFSNPESQMSDAYASHSIKAGWRIRAALGEGRYRLGVHYYNIFLYLLRRLGSMLALSVVLFIALSGGVVYTLLNWKHQRDLTLLKNDLVNNLTHELKTPIFSSSLLLHLLKEKMNGQAKENELLSMLAAENDKLKTRVEKVLDVARIEEGRLILDAQALEMHALIHRALIPFTYRIRQAGGTLQTHLSASSSRVKGDAIHLENVLYNVLDNALKYTDSAPVVRVYTENEKGFLRVRVCDEGMGIPKEEWNLVFEKFYRVDSPGMPVTGGIGLGLNYVKMIMEMHGGGARIANQTGSGTCLELWLPTE